MRLRDKKYLFYYTGLESFWTNEDAIKSKRKKNQSFWGKVKNKKIKIKKL